MLSARRARHEAGVITLNRLTTQGRERPLRSRDAERVVGSLTQHRQQRALCVEKSPGIPRHPLDDAIELDGVRQYVRQLLQRAALRQAALQILRRATTRAPG